MERNHTDTIKVFETVNGWVWERRTFEDAELVDESNWPRVNRCVAINSAHRCNPGMVVDIAPARIHTKEIVLRS